MTPSTSSWRAAAETFKRDQAKAPPGCQTLPQIAEEVGLSEERTRDMINGLIKVGRAEIVRGKMISVTGTLVPTTYYRLIKAQKAAKAAEKATTSALEPKAKGKRVKDSNFDRG